MKGRDIGLILNTAKSKSEKEIEVVISQIANELDSQEQTIKSIKLSLSKKGITLPYLGTDFLRVVMMAIILHDILSQMTPFLVEEYVLKIKEISKRNNFCYDDVCHVHNHANSCLSIMMAHHRKQKSDTNWLGEKLL